MHGKHDSPHSFMDALLPLVALVSYGRSCCVEGDNGTYPLITPTLFTISLFTGGQIQEAGGELVQVHTRGVGQHIPTAHHSIPNGASRLTGQGFDVK